MSTTGSKLYPDSIHLARPVEKIRVLRSNLSGIIEHNRNSKAISCLIMASGLLDGALEELSKCVSEQRHQTVAGARGSDRPRPL
jgi:hypothetical protein